MKRLGVLLAALFVGQLLVLGGMIWRHQSILIDGHEVVLAVRPVDPVSLFRGNYVDLSYSIGTLPFALFKGGAMPEDDADVWVILAPPEAGLPADTPWLPVAASALRPVIVPDRTIALRGTVQSISKGVDATWQACGEDCGIVSVRYGIEAYFASPDKAKSYEDSVRERRLSVIVAVADDGRAAIKALMLDDEVVAREGLL